MAANRRAGFKLFIGGLTSTTTDEDLNEYFSQYGKLIDFIVIKGERRDMGGRDSRGKISRGFGYVVYENIEERNLCLDNIPHSLDGKKVEVKRAVPKGEGPNDRTSKMFLKLPREAKEDDIYAALEEIGFKGRIDSVKVMMTGEVSRGFGFVTFKECEDVDDMLILQKLEVAGQTIYPEKAKPRDQMGNERSRDVAPRHYEDNYGSSRSGHTGGYDNHGPSNFRRREDSWRREDSYEERSFGGRGGGGGGGSMYGGGSSNGAGGFMDGGGPYYDSRAPPAPSYSSGGYGGSGGGGGSGGYGRPQSQYGGYEGSSSFGYSQSSGSAGMGSYNQSASSYGPSKSSYMERGGGQYHPYGGGRR